MSGAGKFAGTARLLACLASFGRDREGLSMVILALARHLPRYNRSMANYAKVLLQD
jgi:hypothetical protein